jgi:hypothetical protein
MRARLFLLTNEFLYQLLVSFVPRVNLLWVAIQSAPIALMDIRVPTAHLFAPMLTMLAPNALMVSLPPLVLMRIVPLALLDTKAQMLPLHLV